MEKAEPFQNGMILYLMHLFFTFVSRLWQIGIILLFAKLSNSSFYYIALYGLFSSSSIFFFSSSIGRLFDKYSRINCITFTLFCKLFLVSLSYYSCGHLLSAMTTTSTTPSPTSPDEVVSDLPTSSSIISSSSYQMHFMLIICASSIADLLFSLITMMIEKDWIVVLSNGDPVWLSTTNSIMTQIDLACDAIAPIIAGILFSFFSYEIVAFLLLGVNATATIVLYIFLFQLYQSWKALQIKSTTTYTPLVDDEELISIDGKPSVPIDFPSSTYSTTPLGASPPTLLGSGCAGAMISYSFLYLTVLSFGSLMLVYLKWCEIPDHWIGLTRGLAALSGFIGALIYPYGARVLGLKYLAKLSIWWQSSLVLIAALGMIFASRQTGALIMIVAVLLSRVGLWCFDLCIRQIAQETIVEEYRGVINGKWNSMTAFFDLSSYLLALIFSNPEQFSLLTFISSMMVCSAAIIFTATNSPPTCGNPDEETPDPGLRSYRNYGSTTTTTETTN